MDGQFRRLRLDDRKSAQSGTKPVGRASLSPGYRLQRGWSGLADRLNPQHNFSRWRLTNSSFYTPANAIPNTYTWDDGRFS